MGGSPWTWRVVARRRESASGRNAVQERTTWRHRARRCTGIPTTADRRDVHRDRRDGPRGRRDGPRHRRVHRGHATSRHSRPPQCKRPRYRRRRLSCRCSQSFHDLQKCAVIGRRSVSCAALEGASTVPLPPAAHRRGSPYTRGLLEVLLSRPFGELPCSLRPGKEMSMSVSSRRHRQGHGRSVLTSEPAARSRSVSIVWRSSMVLFFTAMASARLLPTRMTSRLPRVMPV